MATKTVPPTNALDSANEPLTISARFADLANNATMEVEALLNDLIERLTGDRAVDKLVMRGMLIRARTLNGIASSAFTCDISDLDDLAYEVDGTILN